MQKLKKTCLSLDAYALNGGLEKLKKEIETAVFVINNLAIRGEFTVFAAPPNGGKTLLVLAGLIQAVEGGVIDGDKVFYINCDDNQRGAIAKMEIVEPLGIKMVVPVLADREKLEVPGLTLWISSITRSTTIRLTVKFWSWTHTKNLCP